MTQRIMSNTVGIVAIGKQIEEYLKHGKKLEYKRKKRSACHRKSKIVSMSEEIMDNRG